MIDAAQLGQVARGLERLAELLRAERLYRTVEGAVSRFRRDLLSTIVNYFNGAGDLRLGDVREIVSKGVYNAYTEALKSAGIAKDEIEAEEFAAIDALTVEQTSFVPDFVKAIRAAKGDEAKEDAIKARVDLWTQSINAAGLAGLASARKNESVTWRVGPTEHCDTCAKLNGQTHRRSWFASRNYFPQTPGAAMDCGGYNCQCELIAG